MIKGGEMTFYNYKKQFKFLLQLFGFIALKTLIIWFPNISIMSVPGVDYPWNAH